EALHQAVTLAEECAVFSPFVLMAAHELREVAQEVPQLLAMVNKQLIAEGEPNALTPNQLVLLRELASGVQLKIIAQRLYLSTSTVKTHLSHIYRELGVSNRREAVSRAQDLRLLVRNRCAARLRRLVGADQGEVVEVEHRRAIGGDEGGNGVARRFGVIADGVLPGDRVDHLHRSIGAEIGEHAAARGDPQPLGELPVPRGTLRRVA